MWYLDDSPPIWIKILLFFGIMFIIWFLGFIIKRNIKKVKMKVGSEAINSIDIMINAIQFFLLILFSSFIFEVDSTSILGLSALFGTGIGFAMAVVIGNIVAGFYLIAVRPFGIGDLIMVKGTTGIVLEIGLNYSKLLALDKSIIIIPNKSLLDANLINCSIQLKDLEERASKGFEIGLQSLMNDIIDLQKNSRKLDQTASNKFDSIIHDSQNLKNDMMAEMLGGKELVRYPFTVQLKLNIVSPDIPLSAVNIRMKELNRRWEKKLGYQPRYFFNKYIFRQDVRIVLVMDNPYQVLDLQSEYLEDLYLTVFQELQEVTK